MTLLCFTTSQQQCLCLFCGSHPQAPHFFSCITQTAKVLAEAVIPNEYGIDPSQKLRIGSKICNSLLGKLLADLANMREESLATAVSSLSCFAAVVNAEQFCLLCNQVSELLSLTAPRL